MHLSLTDLAARYGRKTDVAEIWRDIIENSYHVAAFDHPVFPVITDHPQIQVFRWGLIPQWAKGKQEAMQTGRNSFNARSETVFEHPCFSSPIMTGRCIIPSTGWYIWKREADMRIPYYVNMRDSEIFSMAGIWSRWYNAERDADIFTFAIITTPANDLINLLHDGEPRMPAILRNNDEQRWLTGELTPDDIVLFLQPYSSAKLEAHRVPFDFTGYDKHDPANIERIYEPAEA